MGDDIEQEQNFLTIEAPVLLCAVVLVLFGCMIAVLLALVSGA